MRIVLDLGDTKMLSFDPRVSIVAFEAALAGDLLALLLLLLLLLLVLLLVLLLLMLLMLLVLVLVLLLLSFFAALSLLFLDWPFPMIKSPQNSTGCNFLPEEHAVTARQSRTKPLVALFVVVDIYSLQKN